GHAAAHGRARQIDETRYLRQRQLIALIGERPDDRKTARKRRDIVLILRHVRLRRDTGMEDRCPRGGLRLTFWRRVLHSGHARRIQSVPIWSQSAPSTPHEGGGARSKDLVAV